MVRTEMLRLDHGRSPEHILVEESLEETEMPPGPALRCRACGSTITSKEQRIMINGRHDHVFFNPHGHVFEIGCFARAPGALPASSPSTEFSWFPGLAWQVAACAACGAHLGWRFQGGRDSGFFGLILDRLIEEG
ncbi:hypothetical protein C6366_15965 [Desulfonatronum sp. SC1]|nr:hypothetical protein C6366_15965 [Desulfonatronum sp. SC1]